MKSCTLTTLKTLFAQTIAVSAAIGCGDVGNAPERGDTTGETSSVEQPLVGGHQAFAFVNGATGTIGHSYSTNGLAPKIYPTVNDGYYLILFPGLAPQGLDPVRGTAQVVAVGAGTKRCQLNGEPIDFPGSPDAGVSVRCSTQGTPTWSDFIVQYSRRGSSTTPGAAAYVVTTQEFAPRINVTYNSTGRANSMTMTGVGQYDVFLPALGDNYGAVQVSAISSTPGVYCKVEFWGRRSNNTETRVAVRCFDASGARRHTNFSLNYFGPGQVPVHNVGAYAWTHHETLAAYNLIANYAHNSGSACPGGNTGITNDLAGRTAPGQYFLRHSGLLATLAAPHVTAYGSDATWCKLGTWAPFGSCGVEIRTRCFTPGGQVSDSKYFATYASTVR
jgi:hypothetical protein